MAKEHHYELSVTWTGNLGPGTTSYRSYSRAHEVRAEGVPVLLGSSDPAFRGDPSRWNPEQLFLAAVSQCHMLWYLNLAASAGLTVTGYEDRATATMVEESSGAGQFTGITLQPQVTITDEARLDQAEQLHDEAGALCFIARSVNFPVHHQSVIRCESDATAAGRL
jgi:organic hydroperoxide reductase OsmC/OhrA